MELREQAETYRIEKRYNDAIDIYAQIYTPQSDKWIAWGYAYCLEKINKIDEAIKICKTTWLIDKSFEANNNVLSWALYKKYFKHLKETYSTNEIQQIYNIAMFVCEMVTQTKYSPHTRIILRTAKLMQKSLINNDLINNDNILNLLSRINVSNLSEKVNTYEKNGKMNEYQSNKEEFYSIKSKALFNLKKYEQCIEFCKEALTNIDSFHHNNDIWLSMRIALCNAELGKITEAIDSLKILSIKKNHWILFSHIGDLYCKIKDNDNALLFMCRAVLTADSNKMKVSLFLQIGLLLDSMGQKNIAYQHLILSKSIREKEKWSLSTDLQQLLLKYEKENFQETLNIKLLEDFWINQIVSQLGEKHGIITNLNSNGKAGFLSCGKDSYFFKMSSVIGNPIRQGDKVFFCLIDSFDIKKNRPSKEAAYIRLDYI